MTKHNTTQHNTEERREDKAVEDSIYILFMFMLLLCVKGGLKRLGKKSLGFC